LESKIPNPKSPGFFHRIPRILGVDPPNLSAGLGVGHPKYINKKITQRGWHSMQFWGLGEPKRTPNGWEDSTWPLRVHYQRSRGFLLALRVYALYIQECTLPAVKGVNSQQKRV
jgi:hypothetical protein